MAQQVRDVMTSKVTTVPPEARLSDVARIMRDEDIGSVPVVQDERLMGMITDRDIVIRALAEGDGDVVQRTAEEFMSPDVQCCRDDQNVGDVLKEMGEQQLRRLPVVDKEHKLVGIVSLGDLSHEAKSKQAGKALDEITRQAGH